jgi:2-polyprenyl-3-methyl-5-hydroxy-6-metoxy-1,4-benzoquinol methylase
MTRRRCPLCNEDRPKQLATISAKEICDGNTTYRKDALVILDLAPSAEYAFVQCSACGFIYALDEPAYEFLKLLYEQVIDSQVARHELQLPRWVGHQLQLAATLLECFGDSERVKVLDYGCGYGTILRGLSGPAVEAIGYEFAENAAAEARRHGLDVFTKVDEIRSRAPFDGVVLSDVLEHLAHPAGTLKLCRELLRPQGWICVSVPDFSERRAKSTFAAMRRGERVTREANPWEHLNYFSPKSLSALLDNAGFTVDPYATAAFGLRRSDNPLMRWGNTVKSALRLMGFTARPQATKTTLVAQRR